MKIAAFALALLLAMTGLSAVAEAVYVENEWDFVDGSMDVSGGIPEDAPGVLGRIREAGVLRVATEPYFPPQEFIDPGSPGQDAYVASDMDMARLIAERMGVALQIVPMEFSEVLEAVTEGTCDLAISALSYTPERAGKMTLSKGYYYSGESAGTGLIIRAVDAGTITGVADLENRDIVAQSGSLQEAQMVENVAYYRQFRRLSSIRGVYEAVGGGKADAAAVNLEAAQAYIENNPDCGLALVEGVTFVLEPQFDGDRVAAKKGELALIYFVNGVIDELLASGQYEEWYAAAEKRAAELGL